MPSAPTQIKSSALWLLLGNFFNRALGIAAMVVVARFLAPDQIGLVSLATATWGLLAAIFSIGTDAAIIHHQMHDLDYLDTAFWLNLGMCAVLLLATLALAPVAAVFYRSPEIIPVIYCFAAGAFFASLMQIHDSIFNREMAFRALSLFGMVFQILEAAAMMALAILGAGYWSLVLPKLLLAPLKTAVWWRFCSWRPRLNFSWEHARDLLRFSLQTQGARIMIYLNMNADFLIVGKKLDQLRLGLYTFAYNTASWPINNFVFMINSLGLPYFARIKDDLPTLRTQ
jgi:PST family polysaccharide transporter